MTALLDAVGKTISHISKRHKFAPDSEIPSKTLVVIITDGYENSSREYSNKQIKRMIEKQKKEHEWEFLFLGANIDAVETAKSYGINEDRAVTYCADEMGTRTNFDAICDASSCLRNNAPLKSSWKSSVEKYMNKKG